MKTLRFIGMAIAAIALCVNLTACSSDDDGGNNENGGNGTQTTTDSFGVIKGQKKLTKLTQESYGSTGEWDGTEIFTFSYDKNGRLSEAVLTWPATPETVTYNYVWDEKEMSVTCYITSEDYGHHSLLSKGFIKDGKFQSAIDYAEDKKSSTTATYKSGKLTELKCDESNSDSYEIVWNDDKVMSSEDNEYHTYTYDGKTCKGYNPLYIIEGYLGSFSAEGSPLVCAHPELLGLRTNYIPKTPTDDDRYYTFTHTLDDDGYITKIKYECYDYYTDIYTFTWE